MEKRVSFAVNSPILPDSKLGDSSTVYRIFFVVRRRVIPGGEYGGGTVMVWDRGTWIAETDDIEAALKKGDLKFTLQGEKLHGSWVVVRTRGFGSKADKSWLLIKHRDCFASTKDITIEKPRSVVSSRLLAEIAREEGGWRKLRQ